MLLFASNFCIKTVIVCSWKFSVSILLEMPVLFRYRESNTYFCAIHINWNHVPVNKLYSFITIAVEVSVGLGFFGLRPARPDPIGFWAGLGFDIIKIFGFGLGRTWEKPNSSGSGRPGPTVGFCRVGLGLFFGLCCRAWAGPGFWMKPEKTRKGINCILSCAERGNVA
jgi:hypothetical protein